MCISCRDIVSRIFQAVDIIDFVTGDERRSQEVLKGLDFTGWLFRVDGGIVKHEGNAIFNFIWRCLLIRN